MQQAAIDRQGFDAQRTGKGTMEWADHTENIQLGCSNNCRYCYAAQSAHRFKRRERSEWSMQELTGKAYIEKYPARAGVIMFPSTHDITTANVDACIAFLRKVLAAGNRVLIVTKPNLFCMIRITAELREFMECILFRFTIGTLDMEASLYWEMAAPLPSERIAALEMVFSQGWRTSVSMEPLLGGIITARKLIAAIRPFVTDSIWIGKMNKIRTRVVAENDIDREWIDYIEQRQCDSEIVRLYDEFNHDPLIFWKDSIREVVNRVR
jgi:DNA repair photolyase